MEVRTETLDRLSRSDSAHTATCPRRAPIARTAPPLPPNAPPTRTPPPGSLPPGTRYISRRPLLPPARPPQPQAASVASPGNAKSPVRRSLYRSSSTNPARRPRKFAKTPPELPKTPKPPARPFSDPSIGTPHTPWPPPPALLLEIAIPSTTDRCLAQAPPESKCAIVQ